MIINPTMAPQDSIFILRIENCFFHNMRFLWFLNNTWAFLIKSISANCRSLPANLVDFGPFRSNKCIKVTIIIVRFG